MGGAQHIECADLNRRVVKAIHQGIGTESAITPDHGVTSSVPSRTPGYEFQHAEPGVVPRLVP